jgi:poly(hydroxyalkanoate) depolymerase family esterase
VIGDFGSNPGALKAHCYCPKDICDGAPLVVVLHGCTQNASAYDNGSGWSQLADEFGFALLYPEQQRANNPNLCFNWFRPEDARRGSGEALSIRQMIEAMVVAHNLDRQRIFITGLSAGGAMAAAMLATYPEVFAGGGIIAGLAYGTATSVPEAFDRMRGHAGPSEQGLQQMLRRASPHDGPWPRISIWQGWADQTVAPSNAEAIAAQWRGVHSVGTAPTHSKHEGVRTTRVWSDADGEHKIEINLIAGMAHGTPIGRDGLGAAAPFMLDVGISSTRELARFWGIAKRGTNEADHLNAGRDPEPSMLQPLTQDTFQGSAATGPNVQSIIEDALRRAGLLR